jgi:hypothetical protein
LIKSLEEHGEEYEIIREFFPGKELEQICPKATEFFETMKISESLFDILTLP